MELCESTQEMCCILRKIEGVWTFSRLFKDLLVKADIFDSPLTFFTKSRV